MTGDVSPGVGRNQAALGANEERGAKVPFELGNLPSEGRLGQSQDSRRGGEAALSENGEKRSKMAPIRL